MKRNKNLDHTLSASPWLWVMNLGLLLIVVGTTLPLFNPDNFSSDNTFRYIYSAGALLALGGRLATPRYRGTIVRVIRLCRIEIWSCIAFCVGAFFMWYMPGQSRDWLAFTLAGGALQLFTSIMIPRAVRG
ncbi:MAG: hypothetical protein NC111_04255 [Bacteroides sp.]|nr:hypothetical protein [Bacteroides sp.]MCM1413017.1 hypothetical protein [Bacteroides sp.]MCM1471723.1 hypothetical protein [Bacteroides sp.]